MSEEGKAFPHSEAGNSVADLSGNGAAVGDGSVCVCVYVGFSGSSKFYTGPHPVLSVSCASWSPPLRTTSQVQWILTIRRHSLVQGGFCCC